MNVELPNRLMKIIRALPGDKLLLLSSSRSAHASTQLLLPEDDTPLSARRATFLAKLMTAITSFGGLVVQQNHQGQMTTYGFTLARGEVIPLTKDELRQAYSKDNKTGKAIDPPAGITFGTP